MDKLKDTWTDIELRNKINEIVHEIDNIQNDLKTLFESKLPKPTSKLDEANTFRNENFTWINNKYKLSFNVIEEIGRMVWMYKQAIAEKKNR